MHPTRRGRFGRRAHAVTSLLALVVVTDAIVATARETGSADHRATPLICSNTPVSGAPTDKGSVATAAAAVSPSVVSIAAASNAQTDIGSGVVIRSDGVVLTNNHVVAAVAVNGGEITVTAADGRRAVATILGRRPAHDIAVIRAAGLVGITPARLGSSTTLRVGQHVIAIGDALGEPGTVTAGIVSALRRSACIRSSQAATPEQDVFGTLPSLPAEVDLDDLIQTDAHLNPGNSGGALADLSGRVVGISAVSKTADGSPGSVGVGFAIPIEIAYGDARRILADAGAAATG